MPQIRIFRDADGPQVIALWEACGLVVPWNVPKLDISRKVDFQPELFFVAEEGDRVVGTVMAGYEGHRGWVNYLAVSPSFQRHGLGRELMGLAEEKLRALGCPKINLQVRSSNQGVIDFYKELGFQVDDVASLGKRLDGIEY